MTLILGFVCNEGVCLVSDTQVVDTTDLKVSYSSKILTPLKDAPFSIGIAGSQGLAYEFDRRLPPLIDERFWELYYRNIEYFVKLGRTRDEARTYVLDRTEQLKNSWRPDFNITDNDRLPYLHSSAGLLGDCRFLIDFINRNSGSPTSNIDALVAWGKNESRKFIPTLHFIDTNGFEERVKTYDAIGTGSFHVELFFEKAYSRQKNITELVKLAFTAIIYAKEIAKDSWVGFDKEHPPEAYLVYREKESGKGRCVKLNEHFTNLPDVLQKISTSLNDLQINLSEELKNAGELQLDDRIPISSVSE